MQRFLIGLIFALLPNALWADIARPDAPAQTLTLMAKAISKAAPELAQTLDAQTNSLNVTTSYGEVLTLYPDNLHIQLQNAATDAERQTVLDGHVASVVIALRTSAETTAINPAQVYPVLRSPSILPDLGTDFPHQDFPGDLIVYWVADSPTQTASIQATDIAAAGLDQAALAELGQTNLQALARGIEAKDLGGPTMLVLDGYHESSLVLLPELWRGLDAKIGTLIMAVPARDLLVFGDGDKPADLAALRRVAKGVAEGKYAYAISEKLFRWETDHWSVLP